MMKKLKSCEEFANNDGVLVNINHTVESPYKDMFLPKFNEIIRAFPKVEPSKVRERATHEELASKYLGFSINVLSILIKLKLKNIHVGSFDCITA
jgi:hypothetical protein